MILSTYNQCRNVHRMFYIHFPVFSKPAVCFVHSISGFQLATSAQGPTSSVRGNYRVGPGGSKSGAFVFTWE